MTEHLVETAEAFARLALELHSEEGVVETIEAVARFALKAVDCSQASIVLAARRGGIDPGAATDVTAEKADLLQVELGEGPATTIVADREAAIVIPDTLRDDRWPAWAQAVAELGLRSVLAVRLQIRDQTVGVLELFSSRPDAFEPDDVAVAQILARHASVAVGTARQEATLWQAIDARKLIGQAQGILMERFNLDQDQAFAVLRRYSQDNNVKLRDVARLLVDTGRLTSPEGGEPVEQ
ncbi:GAF and ANTAR domain-containing protein [Kribbella sancticallisti]|uniref:GAF and ANTAR domain-containing protein n=1 Tax=Kribbella sancticallisti TaxID=460087 RepID=A0ABN2DZR9_9ACTN